MGKGNPLKKIKKATKRGLKNIEKETKKATKKFGREVIDPSFRMSTLGLFDGLEDFGRGIRTVGTLGLYDKREKEKKAKEEARREQEEADRLAEEERKRLEAEGNLLEGLTKEQQMLALEQVKAEEVEAPETVTDEDFINALKDDNITDKDMLKKALKTRRG